MSVYRELVAACEMRLQATESGAGENLDAATALSERRLAEYRQRQLFWGIRLDVETSHGSGGGGP